MNIRPFRETDTAGVTDLWQAAFPDNPPHSTPAVSIPLKLAFQRELFFVAEADGVTLGTVMAGYDGHRGWLYAVAVRPDRRRHGVGTALVRHAEAALRALGCPKVNLQVRATNAGVVAFYRALGYRVEDRISMGKLLAP
jgi:ribosomal protein S18 acetylase RimI-like enzyme